MGTGSFQGVKRSDRAADNPTHLELRLKGVELYLPIWTFVTCLMTTFIFTYYLRQIYSAANMLCIVQIKRYHVDNFEFLNKYVAWEKNLFGLIMH